jgi:hypothetical protein
LDGARGKNYVWSGLPRPNRREFPYRRWSCMWHNHMGEIGHCYGQLETLMREALQHNAVHICFARNPTNESVSDLLAKIGAALKEAKRIVDPPEDRE